VSWSRVTALLGKELTDLRGRPGLFFPAIFTGAIATLLPLFIGVLVPAFTGERLSDSTDLQIALELYRQQPGARALEAEAAIQAALFQQFLVLLVLSPVAASMSLAAASVVGEKQARTLEPLLVTPITTFELLGAKVLGAVIPSVALTAGFFAVYVLIALVFAHPGVAWILLGARVLGTVFVLGPLAALAALQLAVCASSRVNDARTAQQLGVLVILPVAGLLMGQVFGALQLTVPVIALIAAGLVVVNAGLMRFGIALFDRETILTRWK